MKRALLLSALLTIATPTYPAEEISMWGCAPPGERRSVLYLADRGARSYVKIGTQRVTARVTQDDAGHLWSFGANKVELSDDGIATYYEGGAVKAKFRCKAVNP